MPHLQTLLYSLLLAFLSAHPALSQAPTAVTAPVLAANVYVSTSKGVYLYKAASTGKLTPAGGPFALTGLPIGGNGKYFISLGTNYVHAYAIAANGAIRQQVSQINTQLYAGAECGTTAGAVLDHTGQNLYVQTAGAIGADGSYICDSFQTFKISSTGSLTFTGAAIYDNNRFAETGTPLTITANGLFAYNTTAVGDACQQEFDVFQRETVGALVPLYNSPASIDPTGQPGGWGYWPNGPMAADPANHIAVYVTPEIDGPCGTRGHRKSRAIPSIRRGFSPPPTRGRTCLARALGLRSRICLRQEICWRWVARG